MSNLRIRIRVGPDYSRGGSRTAGYSSTKNAASAVFNKLAGSTLERAARQGTERVVRALPAINTDIYKDLDRFASTAMRFMFSRQSSTSGGELIFNLNDPTMSGMGSAIPFISGLTTGNSSVSFRNQVMSWKTLAKKTLAKKRPNTTYFVYTGKLKWELLDEGVFSQFMKDVLKPGLKYEEIEDEAPLTKAKHKIGRLSVFVAASKKGQNLANMPFLSSGKVSAGQDQTLIARYMGEEIANKLTNARHPGHARPFVSPLLGYWVLNRFPFVVASAVERQLKVQIKADATTGTYT